METMLKVRNPWTAVGFAIISSLAAFLLVTLIETYVVASQPEALVFPAVIIAAITLVANIAYISQVVVATRKTHA